MHNYNSSERINMVSSLPCDPTNELTHSRQIATFRRIPNFDIADWISYGAAV